MPNRDRDIVVRLSQDDLITIADGLSIAADESATVRVMIQEDGLKFKRNSSVWTRPIGKVEKTP